MDRAVAIEQVTLIGMRGMARRATNEPVQRVRSVTWDINQLMIVAKLKAWILATPWPSAPAATGTAMTGTPPIPTTASLQYFANCLPIAASFSWKQKSPKWRLSLLSSIRASNPKKVYLCQICLCFQKRVGPQSLELLTVWVKRRHLWSRK